MTPKTATELDEVVDFCRQVNRKDGPFVWPCEGTTPNAMSMMPYKRVLLDKENKRGKSIKRRQSTAFCIVQVNTNYFQQCIHKALHHRKPGEARSMAFPESAIEDQDLFDQMMNELPDTKTDATNHSRFVWVKVFEHIPVDFRDTARYNRCAAEAFTRGNWSRVRRWKDGSPPKHKAPKPNSSHSVQPPPVVKKEKPSSIRKTQRKLIRGIANKHFGK